MKTNDPLISTVIPAYNQGHFLVEAIESVLNQTWTNLEVVVVNDGSTDNTIDILKKMAGKDQRIRWFDQKNQGFAVAMNRAIEESHGEYIAHLDSDDVMEPDKIELQMEALRKDSEVDLVHTAVRIIDTDGHSLMVYRGKDVEPKVFLAQMFYRSIMGNPTTIMGRKECWVKVPFLEKYKRSVDYERVLRLAERYKFKYLDLPLTKWRRHEENLTNDLEPYRKEQLEILRSYDMDKIFGFIDQTNLSDDEKQLLKGNILYNIEDYDSAAEKFNLLHSPKAYFSLGNCYMKNNDPEQAIRFYKKCLRLDPRHLSCLNNLGGALRKTNKNDEARELFQQALKIKPGYLDAKYNVSHEEFRLTERELRDDLIPYKFSS